MSHSIPQTKKRSPMWAYESNFRYLMKMITPCLLGQRESMTLHYSTGHFLFTVKERCKYTIILDIQQYLDESSEFVDGFSFNVRLCLDARVAEVVSYIDNKRLLPVYEYPNAEMRHRDEKKQANMILNECLCFLYRHGLNTKCVITV